MQTFVRMSKLSNIVGRSDYISNPERQEDIVAAASYADWKAYQAFEREHQRSSKANNEGRELIIALPNEWQQLSKQEMTSRMNELAQRLLTGKSEYQWAVHWNKAHTNLHVHLIFSERNRQYGSSGVWDRDIYLTQDGKVSRRKADRAVDKNGKVKPPVHRKGEPKDNGKPNFTVKDKKFKSKEWLEQTKRSVADFYRNYGISITEKGLLHEYHEGKGSEASTIRTKNECIRRINYFFQRAQGIGFVLPSPPSEQFNAMKHTSIQAIQPDFNSIRYLKYLSKLALNQPELIRFKMSNKEVYNLTRSLLDKAGIPYVSFLPRIHNQDGGYIIVSGEAYRIQIEQIKQKVARTLAPAAPVQPKTPPKPRVDIDSIIALKHDYVRKCCVLSYLKSVHFSTEAQEAFQNAQQLVKDFDTAAEYMHSLDSQIKATINPFKKLNLRSERDEAAHRLEEAARKLQSTLGITLVYQGQEFDSSTATKDHTSAIYSYTRYPISQRQSAAEAEIKRNEMIQSLSAENIDENSVRTSLTAFQTACKGIPEEQQQEAYMALCEAHTPSLAFEMSGYLSQGRRTANENVSKVLATLKPSISDQTEMQKMKSQDVERNRYFSR